MTPVGYFVSGNDNAYEEAETLMKDHPDLGTTLHAVAASDIKSVEASRSVTFYHKDVARGQFLYYRDASEHDGNGYVFFRYHPGAPTPWMIVKMAQGTPDRGTLANILARFQASAGR